MLRDHKYSERLGITLLEVLISIGILAVGLVSVLALIPAGGAYLRKASMDDRAAALIPNAFATMKAAGLFKEDALFWYANDAFHAEKEEQLIGFPRFPDNIQYESISGAEIATWYAMRDESPRLIGTGTANATVTITADGPSGIEKTFTTVADSDGDWTLQIPTNGLSLSDPADPEEERMTINQTGPEPDAPATYYDSWSFRTDSGTITTVIPPSTPARESFADSVNAYRHYRRRRSLGYFYGDALLDFRLSNFSDAEHNANNTPDEAEAIETPQDADVIHRRVRGTVWRYQTGYRDGVYRDYWSYANQITGTAGSQLPASPREPRRYEASSIGTSWVDANRTPKTYDAPDGILEDNTDCYCFSVTAGQEFEIDWGNTGLDHRRFSLTEDDPNHAFVVTMLGEGTPMSPTYILGTKGRYIATVNGFAVITIRLQDAELDYDPNRTGEATDLNYNLKLDDADEDLIDEYLEDDIDDATYRLNVQVPYDFDLRIFNDDAVIAIDPLMTAHLTNLIENNGTASLIPQRRHFAKFKQHFSGYQTDGRLAHAYEHAIPRVNWDQVAAKGPTAGMAIAERLCRPDDALEVVQPNDELAAPVPQFEFASSDDAEMVPLRRRAKRRMSWLVTAQPENNGSVQANWQTGNYFDISVVTFEDRLMPRVGDLAVEGEYAVDCTWNAFTGLITLTADANVVPRDDIRAIFAADRWILLAPKVYSQDQKIDWVQIQTAEIEFGPNGADVEVLPVAQPGIVSDTGTTALVAVIYQGVVAVSRRSVQIE